MGEPVWLSTVAGTLNAPADCGVINVARWHCCGAAGRQSGCQPLRVPSDARKPSPELRQQHMSRGIGPLYDSPDILHAVPVADEQDITGIHDQHVFEANRDHWPAIAQYE